jgi:Reverse transcriptase (RNA-dependent DNA polymerase)
VVPSLLFYSKFAILTEHPYVTVFALDFSKAFDTVRHSTLLDKLARLDLPDEAYNWIKNFLDGQSHSTRFAVYVSTLKNIFASVIQGSGIGPAFYMVVASNLRPKAEGNQLFKFADDTHLNADTCDDELAHVHDWASANNLMLKPSKTLELLVIAPGIRGPSTQLNSLPLIPGIE